MNIRDQKRLAGLLLLRGLPAEDVADTVKLLGQECPWLGGADEVSEEIGIELLADVMPPSLTPIVEARQLVDWHNETVRNRKGPEVEAQNAAYASLVQVIRQFGVEDGLGTGDYWVVEDSFSGSHATVVVFRPPPLIEAMENSLSSWLNGQHVIQKITLINREGYQLFEIEHI